MKALAVKPLEAMAALTLEAVRLQFGVQRSNPGGCVQDGIQNRIQKSDPGVKIEEESKSVSRKESKSLTLELESRIGSKCESKSLTLDTHWSLERPSGNPWMQ